MLKNHHMEEINYLMIMSKQPPPPPLVPAAVAAAKSLQSCPTLCDPIDGSPPGSATPGILQARTLEWVAISFSNAWKWKVKVKSLSPTLSDPMDCSLPGAWGLIIALLPLYQPISESCTSWSHTLGHPFLTWPLKMPCYTSSCNKPFSVSNSKVSLWPHVCQVHKLALGNAHNKCFTKET